MKLEVILGVIAITCFAFVIGFFLSSSSVDTPAPIINNYVDVNVFLPPIVIDLNALKQKDFNFSPSIIVNVPKPDLSQVKSDTFITNNYVIDENKPLVLYDFSLKAIDLNGIIVVDKEKSFAEGTQALTAMEDMTNIEYSKFVYGVMILSINGVKPGDRQYWALYVDGNYSDIGISDIVINKNRVIEWRMESW